MVTGPKGETLVQHNLDPLSTKPVAAGEVATMCINIGLLNANVVYVLVDVLTG